MQTSLQLPRRIGIAAVAMLSCRGFRHAGVGVLETHAGIHIRKPRLLVVLHDYQLETHAGIHIRKPCNPSCLWNRDGNTNFLQIFSLRVGKMKYICLN